MLRPTAARRRYRHHPHVINQAVLGDRLWAAWRQLTDWEERIDEDLGEELGGRAMVLWAISRFGSPISGRLTIDSLIDEELHPLFGDWLTEDMVRVAFALGAGWAANLGADRRLTRDR